MNNFSSILVKVCHSNIPGRQYDLCASIQYTIVEILLEKLEKAINKTGIKKIAIAGGVSANSYLRKKLEDLSKNKKYTLSIPKIEYCTDNAAMIAMAGYFKYKQNQYSDLDLTNLQLSQSDLALYD